MTYIVNTATRGCSVSIGDGAITSKLQSEGYFATITAMISPVGSLPENIRFQDLHVTEAQLEGLYRKIGEHLEYRKKFPL